tara:strand:+ start:79 stop:519 length:441 start_codon:yes stop_codon:yes gene_type:complete
MWAIDDFTKANGATMVVPGSHLFSDDPEPGKHYDHALLTMPAGSIAFVLGSCYHGAGANKTKMERRALTVNYCNGSMRQQENLMLSIHPSKMLSFKPELQDILGFKVCKGAGHLFARDPRMEMERHYSPAHDDQDWMEKRNQREAN